MTSSLGHPAPLTTVSLDQIGVMDLLSLVEHAPTPEVGSESGHSTRAYRIWLECAFERASTASTRRLIEDVLDDIASIGPIDDELTEMVVGALASVEAALECEGCHG